MNKAGQTILIEGMEKEIKDQNYVFLALAVCFGVGFVFFLADSASLVRPLLYLVLCLTYLAFSRYYKKNPARHQEILVQVFRFYCIHTAIETLYGIWPELMSETDKDIGETGKGLPLLLIILSLKMGYLALRIGLAVHFFRILRLMRKVHLMKEEIRQLPS